MKMQLSEGVSLRVIPSNEHEFLIPTNDVAKGYGIAGNTLRYHMYNRKDELKEGVHIIKGVCLTNTLRNAQPNQVFWTKQGVIRVGFFIQSERAKKFRDWVEVLVVNSMVKKTTNLPKVATRNHNRLSKDRLLDIMTDVCLIKDNELRVRIANKLMGVHDED